MAMTVLATRNASDRIRGFLASCMCVVGPGLYVSANMSKRVREQVWRLMERWHPLGSEVSILMVWSDRKEASGLGLAALGSPPYDAVSLQSLAVVRRDSTGAELRSLTTEDEKLA